MISKTQIGKRVLRKRNLELVETINLAKKNDLMDLAKRLSGPTRMQSSVNLGDIGKVDGERVVVVGRVLGEGEIEGKKEIFALGFSDSAVDKLSKSGLEFSSIKDGLEGNKLKDFKIL